MAEYNPDDLIGRASPPPPPPIKRVKDTEQQPSVELPREGE